ncbi:MAG: PD40 domain-containing protein [Acidobacteria bacterium]|nr:PD40 domain-containing protein [Acidobacteriota bacterium]
MNRLVSFILPLIAVACLAENAPVLLRQPSVGRELIAFTYANEIWVSPRTGGDARLLTSGPGEKTTPVISPDGTMIAYTGLYDGNADVYCMPAAGGEARRLTHHPGADIVLGWTPDSKAILFRSARNSFNGFNRLFTVPVSGGLPSEIPLPTGEAGSFSPDGSHLAYVPVTNWRAGAAWKRYRGGRTARIWLADLKDSATVEIPRDNSNDINPMWIGGKVYFLSDRSGSVTLFSYDTSARRVEQLLPASGPDIISAAAAAGVIVIERVGALQIYDIQSKKLADIHIRVAGDIPSLRPHFIKADRQIAAYAISPTGVRAVFEAHGEILTVPVDKGDIRNLTNSPGVADRDPAWSPDGRQIAWFSDEGGEYSLHVGNQDGTGDVKKLALGSPSYFYEPRWSPDSKRILYTDKHLGLYFLELANPKPVLVDTDFFQSRTMDPAWSPDGKWIAYAKQLPSHLRAIWVYSLEDGKKTQVTDGMSDAFSPSFDRSGKYLYFLASTDDGPTQGGLDLSSLGRDVTSSPYVMVLRKDLPSPIAPESDEEAAAEAAKDRGEGAGANPAEMSAGAQRAAQNGDEPKPEAEAKGPGAKAREPKVTVKVDFENIDQRILALPMPARNYQTLEAGTAGVIFLTESPNARALGPAAAAGSTIHRFEFSVRRASPILQGVTAFALSENGKKMLYRQGRGAAAKWLVASVPPPTQPGPQPAENAAGPGAGAARVNGETLKTDAMQVMIDPRAEWRQMYHEAWRIERDFFYDPSLHGVDWRAYDRAYEPYVAALSSRADLDYIFNDMLGEMSVGHMFIASPPPPESDQPKGGLLGADYNVENGRYRFARIYQGENWNPSLRAPLTEPGVNVREGEYLLAVNGSELKGNQEIFELFEGTAGKQTVLKVSSDPEGKNARSVTVVPLETETALRNRAWIDWNRRKVDELSNGRVGYVYLPDTAQGGYTSFNRYYFAQLGREGTVIDERWNRGGMAADYVVDYLRRPVMNYWQPRDGHIFTTPANVIQGAKAMIINMYAGSGGDALPWYFRFHKIGPLVGTRTWGGLIGIGGHPSLMDGGSVTAPYFAFYNAQREWDVENHGVAPDVEIEMSPKAWRQGHDLQLEKSVDLVLEQLRKMPVRMAERPAFPNYHPGGKGAEQVAPAATGASPTTPQP